MRRAIWLLAVGLTFAMPAQAAVPTTISVQGILTDAGGALLPNGPYSLTLSLYDVAAGGPALYSEVHAAAIVVNGGFSVLLGSVTPLGLPFDVPYWLGIQVGFDPELAPRVPLASAPYALSMRLPFSGRNDAVGPALTVRNALGSGIRAGLSIELEDGAAARVVGSFSEFYINPPLAPAGGGIVLDLRELRRRNRNGGGVGRRHGRSLPLRRRRIGPAEQLPGRLRTLFLPPGWRSGA